MYVTVEQVAKAMLVDETPKVNAELVVETGSGTILSCAIGGAALVLGVNEDSLMNALRRVERDGVPVYSPLMSDADLGQAIYTWNDSTNTTKSAIGSIVLSNADEKTLKTKMRVRKQSKRKLLAFKKKVE